MIKEPLLRDIHSEGRAESNLLLPGTVQVVEIEIVDREVPRRGGDCQISAPVTGSTAAITEHGRKFGGVTVENPFLEESALSWAKHREVALENPAELARRVSTRQNVATAETPASCPCKAASETVLPRDT
jgi:hypothetical protein